MPEKNCGKCGLPLANGFVVQDGPMEPWCSSCGRNHRDEYRPVRKAWVLENAQALLWAMGVPAVYRDCSFDKFDAATKDQRRALKAVQSWLTSSDHGLFLCGPCGTGKTHLAVAALLWLRARGFVGRFTSVQELLVQCRDSFRNGKKGLEEILESVCKPDVLVLDDLGTENPTPFTQETVALIIDRAYRDAQVIILTSNFDLETFVERLGARAVDRLTEICFAVRLTGSSYRQKRAAQRASLRNLPASEAVQ
jgi:DNA replication protein DnaC